MENRGGSRPPDKGGGGVGGGHPDPEIRRLGPVSKKIFFRPFGPHFRLEIREGGGGVPSKRRHPFIFAHRRETSTAAKSEEKRMFSQARGVGGGEAASPGPSPGSATGKGPGKTAIEPHSRKLFKEMLSRLSILRIGKTCFLFLLQGATQWTSYKSISRVS